MACRLAMWACDTSSIREPYAISTNRANSVDDERMLPSAIFDEIETAARRIWLVSPNLSSLGNRAETAYIQSARSTANCQTSSFPKRKMLVLPSDFWPSTLNHQPLSAFRPSTPNPQPSQPDRAVSACSPFSLLPGCSSRAAPAARPSPWRPPPRLAVPRR